MRRLADSLYSIAIALWVGGMGAIGYLAAPVLFYRQPDRILAGHLAGEMFAAMAWVGIACGTYLVLYFFFRRGWRAVTSGVCWIVLAMLALVVAGHFGIQPVMEQMKADALPRQVMESALRDRFATWHGISSALYLVQSLLGVSLVIWQERGRR